MKPLLPLVVIAVAGAVAGLAMAGDEILEKDLGLSRTSVFETPEPAPYGYDGSASEIPPLSPLEVPVIPHKTKDFERITLGRNRCMTCHLQPEMIGKAVPAGEPTPIPISHFRKDATGAATEELAGSRWVCTQCHVAQANTELLVGNSTVM